MLILELNPPEGRILNLKIQDLGRFFMNLEFNTRLVTIREDSVNNKITLIFYNEHYIEGDFALEIKEESGKTSHNEATFFKDGYVPNYTENEVEQEDDYDSSY